MSKPALQAYLEQHFGGSFEVKVKTVTVPITPTKIVDHNYERMGLTLVLLGANKVFVSPDDAPSATHGIELISSGASIAETANDDLALVGREHFGIADTAPSDVFVVEIVRYASAP